MPEPPTHLAVERHFRALLADAGLPPPDAVEHEPDAVTFYWHGPRVAVVVERGGEPALPDEPSLRRALTSSNGTRPS
jgi:hypothetical protein